MTLIDLIQTTSFFFALFGIGAWSVRHRKMPLTLAVIISMLFNIIFYLARSFNLLNPVELNLFSSIRVLLMVIILDYIAFMIGRIK